METKWIWTVPKHGRKPGETVRTGQKQKRPESEVTPAPNDTVAGAQLRARTFATWSANESVRSNLRDQPIALRTTRGPQIILFMTWLGIGGDTCLYQKPLVLIPPAWYDMKRIYNLITFGWIKFQLTNSHSSNVCQKCQPVSLPLVEELVEQRDIGLRNGRLRILQLDDFDLLDLLDVAWQKKMIASYG